MAVLERTPQELVVRYLERAALGTPYTHVVQRMGELTRHRALSGSCYLAVDATGVGVPVVESLRAANLGCRALSAVTITGGERARQTAGFGVGVEHWTVPRADLLGRVQVLLEKGELKIAKKMRESGRWFESLSACGGGARVASPAARMMIWFWRWRWRVGRRRSPGRGLAGPDG